jgi:membrane protein
MNEISGKLLEWSKLLVSIIVETVANFSNARASEVAASLAYYALFSIFPFFIALVIGASYFLERDQVFLQVRDVIAQNFPASHTFIESNLRVVLDLRGQVGLIGLVVLIWAATGFFSSLIHNINRAWPDTSPRTFFRMRFSAILIVIFLALAVITTSLGTSFFNLVSSVRLPYGNVEVADLNIWPTVSRILSWVTRVILFYLLYSFAPTTKVPVRAAIVGALLSGTLWEVTLMGFLWYLTSGFAHYELVYGSLNALIVLMIWIYLNGMIILLGAHLSATVGTHIKNASSG